MSELDQHVLAPDEGVVVSDLFIYYAQRPGTGGLVTRGDRTTCLRGKRH